jgi:hypothetical protein
MNFVIHHMFQPLVISRSQKDLGINFSASMTTVHDLITTRLVIILAQQFGDLLHINGVIKGGGVTNLALVRPQFALQKMHNKYK